MPENVLIVGVGQGLSASLARMFFKEGMRIVLAARDIGKLASLAKETKARLVSCDSSKIEDVEHLFEECDNYLYGTGMDDEPKPTTSVEGYRNSYFVFTGLSSDCNCEIDSETGEVILDNQTYSNLFEFYGCLDEDSESIQGVKII